MRYLIGVDIGTTNIKAVALDDDGQLLALATRPVQTLLPFPGAAEQQPAALLKLVVRVIREVRGACPDTAQIAGLVFSGAMHSLLAVDRKGSPLTNAWLWSDLRAVEFSEALRGIETGRTIYQNTGTPVHAMSPLLKLMWMRENQPGVFEQAYKFLGIKDFILRQLLGEYVCDASVASASGLLNTRSGQWDMLALKTAGIDPDRLPRVVPPGRSFPLPAPAAAWLGLPAGLPLLPGASDGALANIGSGAAGPDLLAVTIGTSAALRMTLEQPATDPDMRTFCYRVDDRRFIAGGASNNGSNTLDWLRKQVLRTTMPAGTLLGLAGKIPAGCAGLLCIPYLHGERAPVWNARAVGVFHGMTAAHGRDHFIRAALEGVVLNLKRIAEPLPQTKNVRRIAFSGGAAKNALWRQVLADVFQKPVLLPDDDRVDASARGAVILARDALGLPPMPGLKLVESAVPNAQNVEKYTVSFERFVQLCALNL